MNLSEPGVRLGVLSEREWQTWVLDVARLAGWTLRYHTFDSRRSGAGFPDLLLARPRTGEVIAVELKSERGRITADQAAWLAAFEAAGVPAFVWRPSDHDEVVSALRRR